MASQVRFSPGASFVVFSLGCINEGFDQRDDSYQQLICESAERVIAPTNGAKMFCFSLPSFCFVFISSAFLSPKYYKIKYPLIWHKANYQLMSRVSRGHASGVVSSIRTRWSVCHHTGRPPCFSANYINKPIH